MEHLNFSHRDASSVMAKDDEIQEFVKCHLSYNSQYKKQIYASEVDIEKYVTFF